MQQMQRAGRNPSQNPQTVNRNPQGRSQNPPMNQAQWGLAIKEELTRELVDHLNALPAGFNQERFVLNAVAMVNGKSEDFCNVSVPSIIQCLAKGAYLGLDFLNGECYAIPYKGVATFQTDYKGEIKLAKKYSRKKIADIYAKNVRKGDDFEEIIKDGHQSINFRPIPFSDEEIIGTFAVVRYEDGSMIYDTMSASEIEKTRESYSKAKNSPAWRNSPGEMYKKTVLRRLLKLVDLEFDSSEQIEAFRAGNDVEFEQTKDARTVPGSAAQGIENDQVIDVFADELVDVREEW